MSYPDSQGDLDYHNLAEWAYKQQWKFETIKASSVIYQKPFTYDPELQRIFDKNGIELCMMRGWSQLSRKLSEKDAILAQDYMGNVIVALLNDCLGENNHPDK